MTKYPNLNHEAELLKTKTNYDEIKDLKYRTEGNDYENILKSPKADSDCYK